jgi:TolA-binding protein
MDCENFDQILVGALYDELDELTLTAAKRHADGCQRCRTAWSGLKATRSIGRLPIVEAPESLENRILARAREAHRNVSWPKRVGRAVSWAGAFAMRPQTAMAALLLLMLGTSLIFVRAKPDRSGAPSRVSITERGVPEQAPADRPWDRPMLQSRGTIPAPPGAAASPPARKDEDRAKAPEPAAPAPVPARLAAAEAKRGEGFQPAQPAPAAGAAAPRPADDLFAEAPSEPAEASGAVALGEPDSVDRERAPAAAAAPAGDVRYKSQAAGSGGQAADPYASAMALYSAGRYAEAEKAFSAVAASGGKNAPSAALYAAKSAEANLGCGSAAPKYESVASRFGGTSAAPEALWRAAGCYKTLGVVDRARSLYLSLRSVAGYRDRAEAELANLAPAARNPPRPAAKAAAPPPR